MTFESDLRDHLIADAAIVALAGERIYRMKRPTDSAVPAITWLRVSGRPVMSLAGFTSGLHEIRIQIDCWATSAEDVSALASAVLQRMAVPASTFKAVPQPDQEFYEDDVRLYRRLMDFNVWFTE